MEHTIQESLQAFNNKEEHLKMREEVLIMLNRIKQLETINN